jgi:hypothetical protein
MEPNSLRLVLMCSTLVASSLAAAGCGSDNGAGLGTGGGASGTGGDTAAGGASGTGGQTATGGGATGGEAGAEPVQKDCATKTVVTTPLITDFESYDGATAVDQWDFSFNGDASPVYAGPYGFDDGTGEFFFGMVAGNNSNYGISISNTGASEWGGGFGFWMGCVDASGYSGITFWVRGSTPTGKANVSLAMEETNPPDEDDPAGGGTCIDTGTDDKECSGPSAEFDLTDTWTQIQISWSSFDPGMAAAGVSVPATGDNIAGISFNSQLRWIEDPNSPGTWIAELGAYELVVDDLSFY